MSDETAIPLTGFEYRYRDASNFKASNCLLLRGVLSDADRERIKAKLEGGEFFIAEQVGVPTLYHELFVLSGGPSDDDHCWHEFAGFNDAVASSEGQIWGPAEQLVSRFVGIERWDDEVSPTV